MFWVIVPVLSEQITSQQPSVSTEWSRLIITLRFASFVTPIERIIVTTTIKLSGIAATAMATAVISDSDQCCFIKKMSIININTAIASTTIVITLPNLSKLFWRVVGSSCFSLLSISAILPISASWPVATITPAPLPYVTTLEEKHIFFLSPSAVFSFKASSTDFSTATLSPVSMDSSHFKLAHSKSRISAGTTSPASNKTTSPTTSSFVLTNTSLPSRITFE